MPDRNAQPDLDFRGWMQDQGKGEWSGPKVQAAGRIMLSRDAGKLKFINIQDWTGNIQLLVGKAQVGDESWALAECSTWATSSASMASCAYTKTGELTIFAEKLHFLTKSIAPPPEKHAGLADTELRQRMRYLDLTYGEGVVERFQQPHQDRAVDPQHAEQPRLLRDRRPDAARHRRRRGGPAVHHASQHARSAALSCGSPWSCTSSGCWSAAWSGFTSWAASIATKASARGTIPNSRCWRRIRPSATTAR